jgi:transposase-like protein
VVNDNYFCPPDNYNRHYSAAVELRTCRDVKSQQRLLAARLAASGQWTMAQIAEQLGIRRRRFFDWMNALKAGGLVGLLERQHGGGAAPQVKGDAYKELLSGLQSGRWKRAREIQHWLRDRLVWRPNTIIPPRCAASAIVIPSPANP